MSIQTLNRHYDSVINREHDKTPDSQLGIPHDEVHRIYETMSRVDRDRRARGESADVDVIAAQVVRDMGLTVAASALVRGYLHHEEAMTDYRHQLALESQQMRNEL